MKAENKKGICFEVFSNNVSICLFGATGDLASKKIIPSLYRLYVKEYVRENFFIINVGSKDFNDESFREYIEKVLKEHKINDTDRNFLERNYYHRIDYDDLKSYKKLSERFNELSEKYSNTNRLFYLAVPPSNIINIVEKLVKSKAVYGKKDSRGFSRIIIEKPYGNDFCHALEVDSKLKKLVDENSIYRIDHYLGKDTVFNLLLLKSTNMLFDKTFNKDFVDSVQITVYEDIGIENRARYFDSMGIFKDMISHILQLVSLIAMDSPKNLSSESIKKAKLNILKNMIVGDEDYVRENYIRAQYVSDGILKAYREENGVPENSMTETFAAFKMEFNCRKWKGVPFYVKVGKRMGKKLTRIDVVYKKIENEFVKKYSLNEHNIFSFIIQPEESIELSFNTKAPGPKFCIKETKLSYSYENELGELRPTDYERLILDAVNGDRTLFLDSREIKYLWGFIENVDRVFKENLIPLYFYRPGEIPDEAKKLPEKDGRKWIYL